jgi:hypothetical protein
VAVVVHHGGHTTQAASRVTPNTHDATRQQQSNEMPKNGPHLSESVLLHRLLAAVVVDAGETTDELHGGGRDGRRRRQHRHRLDRRLHERLRLQTQELVLQQRLDAVVGNQVLRHLRVNGGDTE